MSFLDDLESNLKSMESREERGDQNSRDAKLRDAERARVQASAAFAEQLRQGPYAAELLRQATRLGHAMRTKVHLAWLGTTLRLEARGSKLELRPAQEGVVAFFIENNTEVRSMPLDLAGDPESLVRAWLASLPAVPAAVEGEGE
ncbi:MAG: hypothetical protein ABSG65_23440 [Bryobacteraceae bacterium]|jgi:hypothetical protein